ncbi:MAG: hypothetical protein KDH17_14545 [Rhodocyclaceae bacterium]|nr:hypothetical protein [Rhodocyclaceae bacterium]
MSAPKFCDAGAPPCFVLGIETQIGVGVVRELGRAGVEVIGLANRERSIGRASRHLARSVVVGPGRDDALVRRIRELGRPYGDAVLLAVSETDIAWLIANRDALHPVRPLVPSSEAFRRVLDKANTLDAAREIGIRVPHSVCAESLDEWQVACESLRYPVIVKWPDPMAVIAALRAHGLALHKIEYALDAEQLRRIGARYQAVGHWPMIQEYCPGRGLGQFFYMHDGRALRRFQHLRVAEWPPEGGFSSVCDVVPLSRHVELQEQSIALLQALGWEGCAMVEYRLDEASGSAVLMEINGRFWGSFPLAVQAGAGFARYAYEVQGRGRTPQLPAPADRLRCRMVATELKRLARILLQPAKIHDPAFVRRPGRELWRFVSDFFRPRTRYYLWDTEDPGPWLADLRNYASRALRR